MKNRVLMCLVAALLLIFLASCSSNNPGNFDTGAMNQDPSNVLDLSEYSAKGYFGDENAIWVQKSDYTGTQFGCIDREGNFIVPLTSAILGVYDYSFTHGLSIVRMKADSDRFGDYAAIYNDKGKVVGRFHVYATTDWEYLNNGNIFFTEIDMYGVPSYYHSSNAYMYCVNTSKFEQMPIPSGKAIPIYDLKYSDGLMLIYSSFYKNPGTKYYDENGNLVLDVDKSNPYYKDVMYATDFTNGEATIVFVGLDQEWYSVTIDKSGKWLDEPTRTSRYEVAFFS